jgi:O-antigen/teichoic acid export membrane protein
VNIFASTALTRMVPAAVVYVTSTGSLLLGQGAQLIGFVVLARFLGAEQFGLLMTITAMTAIGMGLSGLGTDEVMLRRCVREPNIYRKLLGHSVILIVSSGLLISLCAVVGLQILLGDFESPLKSIETLSIFSLSNIALARWIIFTEWIFIAKQRINYANVVNAVFAISRALTAIIACFIFGVDKLETWAYWHGGIYILGALACIVALRRYGTPQWCVLREEVWRGLHFSTPNLIDSLRQNIDRLALAVVATPVTVAAYSVASNILRYSLVTISSFGRLFYSKLASAGVNGASGTLQLAIKYVWVIVGIGVLNSIGLFVIAPFLPSLFGREFGASIHYLMVLCWVAILYAISSIAYDAMGGAEKHGVRALVFNLTGLIGCGLIAGLTYIFGVNGTIGGIFISQAIIAIAMWLSLIALGKAETRS